MCNTESIFVDKVLAESELLQLRFCLLPTDFPFARINNCARYSTPSFGAKSINEFICLMPESKLTLFADIESKLDCIAEWISHIALQELAQAFKLRSLRRHIASTEVRQLCYRLCIIYRNCIAHKLRFCSLRILHEVFHHCLRCHVWKIVTELAIFLESIIQDWIIHGARKIVITFCLVIRFCVRLVNNLKLRILLNFRCELLQASCILGCDHADFAAAEDRSISLAHECKEGNALRVNWWQVKSVSIPTQRSALRVSKHLLLINSFVVQIMVSLKEITCIFTQFNSLCKLWNSTIWIHCFLVACQIDKHLLASQKVSPDCHRLHRQASLRNCRTDFSSSTRV